jgi:hypothetical protein
MQPKDAFVVVSRFQEDVSWTRELSELGFHVAVYEHDSKGAPYAINEGNRGREASVYLKYIVDHYDTLHKYTVFTHGDSLSWHHEGSLVERIVSVRPSSKELVTLNKKDKKLGTLSGNDLLPQMRKFYKKYLEPSLGPMKDHGGLDLPLGFPCCAQFVVHRDLILQHPREFYEALEKYVVSEQDKKLSKNAGHLMEWTFHVIFEKI